MGVKNLNLIIKTVCPEAIVQTTISSFTGKCLAIDGTLWIYQILCAVRKSSGDILSSTGENISLYYALFNRLTYLLKKDIRLVFVFDGKPPNLKDKTIQARKQAKQRADEKINRNDFENDVDKGKLLQRSTHITPADLKMCKEFLTIMGVPYVDSPEECDGQCAKMFKEGIIDGIISEDTDMVVFGGNLLVRDLNIQKDTCEVLDMRQVYSKTLLTQKDLAIVSVISGCDYYSGVRGYGIKRIVKLINEGKVDDSLFPEKDKDLVNQVISYYLEPTAKSGVKLKFIKPDLHEVVAFMRDRVELNSAQLHSCVKKLKHLVYDI